MCKMLIQTIYTILFQLWKGFEESGAHSIFLPKALPLAQIGKE